MLLLCACVGTIAGDSGSKTVDSAPVDSAVDSGRADTGDTVGDSGDSGDPVDTGPLEEPVCGVRPAEDWWWWGECPEMGTPTGIRMTDCAMTLAYGPMDMGMPYSATVEGDRVTFADGENRTGCVGFVVSADEIDGYCDGRCTFELKR